MPAGVELDSCIPLVCLRHSLESGILDRIQILYPWPSLDKRVRPEQSDRSPKTDDYLGHKLHRQLGRGYCILRESVLHRVS